MGDNVFVFFSEVYKNGGILSLISVGIFILALLTMYEIMKTAIVKWKFPSFKKKKSQPLVKHHIFNKLDSIIEYQIDNIRIDCPLRNKIFKKILIIRFELMKKLFMDEATRDFNITQDELTNIWKTFFAKLECQWYDKVDEIGLPYVIIKKFSELRSNIDVAIYEILNNLCMRPGDVEETVSFIFDVLSSIEISSLFTAGEAINSLNGELSGVEFEGVKCMHCHNNTCVMKATHS